MLKVKLRGKIPRAGDSFIFNNSESVCKMARVCGPPPPPQIKFMSFFQDSLYEQRLLARSCVSLRVCPSIQEVRS